jgi:hypothetical protein
MKPAGAWRFTVPSTHNCQARTTLALCILFAPAVPATTTIPNKGCVKIKSPLDDFEMYRKVFIFTQL